MIIIVLLNGSKSNDKKNKNKKFVPDRKRKESGIGQGLGQNQKSIQGLFFFRGK